jgi:aspartate kinase
MLESALIRGVALDVEEAKVTLDEVPDRPGIAAAIFKAVAAEGIHVDMIVRTSRTTGAPT